MTDSLEKDLFLLSTDFRRAAGEASMPPYLLRHLKNVAERMPCSRQSLGTGLPASACLSTAMIWLSEKRDVFM